MRIITPPALYEAGKHDISCFLGGGITNCEDWQSEVIRFLKEYESNGVDLRWLVLYNPRQKYFPIDNPDAAEEQIRWEYKYLNACSVFSMYFCNSDSDQPICMYELGRYALGFQYKYPDWENRLIVSVEKGYRRTKDVDIQLKLGTYNSISIDDDANPKKHAEKILETYLKFAELKYNFLYKFAQSR